MYTELYSENCANVVISESDFSEYFGRTEDGGGALTELKAIKSPAKRKKSKDGWKALCWTNTTTFSYETRIVFDKLCMLWVSSQKRSVNNLRDSTGFRADTIYKALEELEEAGLITDERVPQYNPQFLYPTSKFTVEKWWKSCQGRNVVPEHGDKLDILLAFIKYHNEAQAGKPLNDQQMIGAAYLAKVTGLEQRTVQRLITQLEDKQAVKRNKKTGGLVALVEYDGKVLEYPEFMKAKLSVMLATCNDRELKAQLYRTGLKKFNKFCRVWQACTKNFITTFVRIAEIMDTQKRSK